MNSILGLPIRTAAAVPVRPDDRARQAGPDAGRRRRRRAVSHVLAVAGLAWAIVAGTSATAIAAQPPPDAVARAASRPGPGDPDFQLVRPGLYRVNGADQGDAGQLVRFDATGLVIVDMGSAGVDLRSAGRAERSTGGPSPSTRALVPTHSAAERAADIVQAADAGYTVIVPQRALGSLPAGSSTGGSSGRIHGYASDYLLRAGAFEVEVEYVGSGRTGADSVVMFRDLHVLAVGDLYTEGTPELDRASGGSYAGWVAAIDHLLWFDDFDLVVPRRGPPVGRAQLEAFRKKLLELAARP